jgi:hypothetical protein
MREIGPVEILKRTAAPAETDHNLEIIDCVAILHGYIELATFQPDDPSHKKQVHEAVARLLQVATKYPRSNGDGDELLPAKKFVSVPNLLEIHSKA